MRRSKEREQLADEQVDAPDTVVATEEGRWRAGVNRQAQPSAQEHQRAAGLASGAKRKAIAMSEEERKARKAAHMVEVRAQQKAAREAAAAAAAAEHQVTLQRFNDLLEEAHEDEHPDDPEAFESMGEYEWEAFRAWMAEEEEELNLDNCIEFYEEWSRPYGGPREEWERRPFLNMAAPRVSPPRPPPAEFAQPVAPPAPDDDPDYPYGGSADCFYEGPNDHDIAEQRMRQDRLCRERPGYVRLTVLAQQSPGSVKARLQVVKEDYNDSYEIDQERLYNEDARRSAFYGLPSGDLPPGSAAPFGWVPLSGVAEAEPPTIPRPFREDIARYGPVANNPKGDKLFHKDRALWYESIMHEPLTGTPTEQWEKADKLGRSLQRECERVCPRPVLAEEEGNVPISQRRRKRSVRSSKII